MISTKSALTALSNRPAQRRSAPLSLWCPTMSGSSKLRVEVLGDEIIVILPATSYGVTYCKPGNSPHLVAKNFVSKIDTGAPITQAEFLAEAWRAANVTARDLGWIA
jgi:hypothetical protein